MLVFGNQNYWSAWLVCHTMFKRQPWKEKCNAVCVIINVQYVLFFNTEKFSLFNTVFWNLEANFGYNLISSKTLSKGNKAALVVFSSSSILSNFAMFGRRKPNTFSTTTYEIYLKTKLQFIRFQLNPMRISKMAHIALLEGCSHNDRFQGLLF